MKRFIPSAELLAACFCETMHTYVGARDMAKVVALNACETNLGICHSHDFVDANVVMDEAYRKCAGYLATDTGGNSSTVGAISDAVNEVWQEAWELAIAGHFALPKPGYVLKVRPTGKTRGKRLLASRMDDWERVLKFYNDNGGYEPAAMVETRSRRFVALFR